MSALAATRVTATTALVATVGAGAAGWAIAVPRMRGMDMGVATTLGSFPFFLSVWVPMMAAMMLPGVIPSVFRAAGAGRQSLGIALYAGSYLAVWALVGLLVFALYRPHGPMVAGVIAVGAGLYELTPLKQRFRRMCQARAATGFELGACCVGSSAGLMLVMLALGAMSLAWMAVITVVVLFQKVVAPRAVIDVPIAVAIITVGLVELAR